MPAPRPLRSRPLRYLFLIAAVILVPAAGVSLAQAPLTFASSGHTFHGDWHVDATLSRSTWQPGDRLTIQASLRVDADLLPGLSRAGIKASQVCLLVTAERTFDADGWMRLASDERMSTLLTPTGLAIEGGVQGAVTNRYGYEFRTPFDQFVTANVAWPQPALSYTFSISAALPADLPPGLYRLRFDVGVRVGTRLYNINGFSFAVRGFSDQAGTNCYFYSPVVAANGTHVSGRTIDASGLQARFPWLLLAQYNSNGYRGVVADEDAARFATSDRSIIPDEVILPLFDDRGNRLAYSLEPRFPTDTIDPLVNIPWNWSSGEITVRITDPGGGVTTIGPAPFVAKSGSGPTTKNVALTAWKPSQYGRYTVSATGWIADESGRTYHGGGTYHFWIAKRMTLATATFQGMAYPVGSKYGRDIQFNPPVPADVEVEVELYPNSDANAVRTLSYTGTASRGGVFTAAQGMQSFALDAPGEYHARVIATYEDADKHLWVCAMRHAGVVYAEDSPVIARGKKLFVNGTYVDRGDTNFEGYVERDGTQHLAHITFPYQAGDVLLIASEGQGANKIEPVLTYQMRGDTSPWDARLQSVGATNLRIKTTNGYSPHLFPEYITDIEYYYGAAPRPGFMSRFIVGESTVRAPYWPVSPNSFGGQIGASSNGDLPGDVYRLLGGVVLRRKGQAPMYSGYMASAFLLPKYTNNNRVVGAGSEDLVGPTGERARFFLVGLRPGMAYEVGSTFRPAVQIDPILPASVHFVLMYPDGRQQVADGTGDRFGSFAGAAAWPLDVAGVYRYQVTARWNGFEARMPGLPVTGGEFYVYSIGRVPGNTGLKLDALKQTTFSAAGTLTLTGSSTAMSVRYAVITPGAVLAQGQIPVVGGKFRYVFDPRAANGAAPIYDIANITTGQPQIGRVVHITFFSEEKRQDGRSCFDFARVIIRGTTAIVQPTAAWTPSEREKRPREIRLP